MEFVNTEMNSHKYGDDPLAPDTFGIEYSCAVTLFANPLCWMEVARLSQKNKKYLSKLIHAYKSHQEAILCGRVFPIGEEPSGRSWTGFQSTTGLGKGYLIIFREWTDRDSAGFVLNNVNPGLKLRIEKIAGLSRIEKLLVGRDCSVRVSLRKPRSFVLLKYEIEK